PSRSFSCLTLRISSPTSVILSATLARFVYLVLPVIGCPKTIQRNVTICYSFTIYYLRCKFNEFTQSTISATTSSARFEGTKYSSGVLLPEPLINKRLTSG